MINAYYKYINYKYKYTHMINKNIYVYASICINMRAASCFKNAMPIAGRGQTKTRFAYQPCSELFSVAPIFAKTCNMLQTHTK